MLKVCNTCGLEKPLEDFPLGKYYKDGYRSLCKTCNAEYYREYYKKDPERYKKKSREQKHYKRHNLTDIEYQRLMNLHNGLCHLCRNSPATRIDHDHSCCSGNRSCGKCVRGILCSSCNTALGLLKDNLDTVQRINQYLAALV